MKYITTREAAEICGVSTVTMQLLAKAGTLDYKLSGKQYRFKESDIKKYAEKIGRVYKANRSIDEYLSERESLVGMVEEKRKEAEIAVYNLGLFPQRVIAMESILNEFLTIYKEDFSEEEKLVITRYIEGRFLSGLDEELGWSKWRAQSLYNRALRKICDIRSRESRIMEENERLREENALLVKKVTDLECGRETEVGKKTLEMMNVNLNDCCLSVRLLNCCRFAGVKTVADLAKATKNDLLKIRLFGRKSLTEAETFLADHGLEFGMKTNEIISRIK